MPDHSICECCKIRAVETTEVFANDADLFYLCKSCSEQLHNNALRPLELFNLTAIHGSRNYINDDFYDFDTGEATQPAIKVIDKRKFPFPLLGEIKNDPQKLVDYACVQYFTDKKVLALLQKHDKQTILDYLDFKVAYNRSINYKAYEIAAGVLGPFAADWIRKEWANRKADELPAFAEALAKCLPFDEAFKIISEEAVGTEGSKLTQIASGFLYFLHPGTLQWIEQVQDRIINVSDHWGSLAAASGFDWETAKKWLAAGRPLSIIALDALYYCTGDSKAVRQDTWLRNHPPTRLNTSLKPVIIKTVNEYLEKDIAPRIKNTVRRIIDNLEN